MDVEKEPDLLVVMGTGTERDGAVVDRPSMATEVRIGIDDEWVKLEPTNEFVLHEGVVAEVWRPAEGSGVE